jgi:hypothetical protein
MNKKLVFVVVLLLLAPMLIVSFYLFSLVTPGYRPTVHSSSSETTTPFPTQASTFSSPQMFNVDLAYAYVGEENYTGSMSLGNMPTMTMHPVNLYPALIYLKFTYIDNPEREDCDAKFEGYLIQLSADTGTTISYTDYEGTNFSPSFSALPPIPPSDSGSTAGFTFNLTANQSFLGVRVTDAASLTSGNSSLGLWSSGPPNAISITVARIGWITVCGGVTSTITNPASGEIILQAQLERFGDGFLYNKIVPEDQMSKIDPLDCTAVYEAAQK